MILTSFAILLALMAIFRPLRDKFFILHSALVLAASWYIGTYIWTIRDFSYYAFIIFLGLHLISINLVMIVMYFYDKRASERGGWRISEKKMHTFSFIGGTFGAFLGQKIFRHKTKKKSFKSFFWFVLLIQIIILIFASQVILNLGY